MNNDARMDANDVNKRTAIPILRPEINIENDNLPAIFTDAPTDSPDAITAKMDARYGKHTNSQRLRRRKRRDDSHLHASTHEKVKRTHKPKNYGHFHAMQHVQECQMHYYDTTLTQYNLKK